MSMPVIRLRQVVGFPGNIVGGVGIEVTKAHGTVTIDTDWSDLSSISAIPTSPTSFILTFDSATGVYVLVPSHLLGGAASGIADAPTGGVQYGRQSGVWSPVAFDTRATAIATTILGGGATIQLRGYASVGDGGAATYARISTPSPVQAWHFQSADGQWWELQGNVITPETMGGSPTATTANDAAFRACVAYLGVRGGGKVILDKMYQRTDTLIIDQPDITFTSNNGGGVWLRGDGLSGAGSTPVFHVAANNLTFQDIEIKGDALPRAQANFAIYGACDNILIQNCDIHDLLNAVWLFNCKNIRILYNRITDLSGGGFQMSNGASEFIIHGNDCLRISDDVCCAVTEAHFVTDDPITFPTLVKANRGIISNNSIRDTLSSATPIRVLQSDAIIITGNNILRCPQAGISCTPDGASDTCNFITIANNTILLYGLHYSGDPTFAAPFPADGATAGILVLAAQSVIVEGNNIVEGTPTGHGRGIQIDGRSTNIAVRNNRISLTTIGISMTSLLSTDPIYDVEIDNNTLTNLGSWGLILDPGAVTVRDIVIRDNVFRFINGDGSAGLIRVANTGASKVWLLRNMGINRNSGVNSIAGTSTAVTDTDTILA